MGIVRVREWLPYFLVCLAILVLIVLSASAGEAPAPTLAVVPVTDYMGISTAIIAIGTLISTVLGAIAILINALSSARIKRAEANSLIAAAAAAAAEKTAIATEIKVDGSLAKFLDMLKDSTVVQGKLIREGATAAATLAEKTAQKEREQVATAAAALTAAAVAASRGTRSGDAISSAPDVMAAAEEKARKLKEDAEEKAKKVKEEAEVQAKQLIEEARRVLVSNTEPIAMKIVQDKADDPIRTQVVQNAVDDPLEVTETDKRKPKDEKPS